MAPASASKGHDFHDISIPGSGRAHLGNFYQGPVYNGAVFVYNSTAADGIQTTTRVSFDFVTCISSINDTYKRWDSACGHYTEITASLDRLRTNLNRVEAAASSSALVLVRTEQDRSELEELLSASNRTVREAEFLIAQYELRGLSKSRARNWSRIQVEAAAEADRLSYRLQENGKELSTYIAKLGLTKALTDLVQSHLHVLPEKIQQSIDGYAAQVRAGTKEGSIMTAYEGDDKHVWRQVRRELFGDGFTSRHLHKYKPQIKRYLKSLADSGQLSEDEPSSSESPNIDQLRGTNSCSAQTDSMPALESIHILEDETGPSERDLNRRRYALEPKGTNGEYSVDSNQDDQRPKLYVPAHYESTDDAGDDCRPHNLPLEDDGPILQFVPDSHTAGTFVDVENSNGTSVDNHSPRCAQPRTAKVVVAQDQTPTVARRSAEASPDPSLSSAVPIMASHNSETIPQQEQRALVIKTTPNRRTSLSETFPDMIPVLASTNVCRFRLPRLNGYRNALYKFGYSFVVEQNHYLSLIALSRRQRDGLMTWCWMVRKSDSDGYCLDIDEVGDVVDPNWRWTTPRQPHPDATTWAMVVPEPYPGPLTPFSPSSLGPDNLSLLDYYYGQDFRAGEPSETATAVCTVQWPLKNPTSGERDARRGRTWVLKYFFSKEAASKLRWSFGENEWYYVIPRALYNDQVKLLCDLSKRYG